MGGGCQGVVATFANQQAVIRVSIHQSIILLQDHAR
jgi:hypothetical protein